jgi:hypothetical protein
MIAGRNERFWIFAPNRVHCFFRKQAREDSMICVNGPDHAVDAQPSANMESTSIATFKGNSASPYFLGWHSLEKPNDFMSATVSSGSWRSSSVSSLLEARVSAKLKVDCRKA